MKENESHLRYRGTDLAPCLGDHLRFLDHAEDLVVDDIIDTPQKLKDWGLEEHGVMLKGEKHGLVFTSVDDPELEFVSRAK
jgi:hypothetical protein